MGVYDADFRDNVNTWIENQVAEVQNRRRVSGQDKVERDILTLFRYLTIMSRCLAPYSLKDSLRVNADIQAHLEHLVCHTLARLVDIPEAPRDSILPN